MGRSAGRTGGQGRGAGLAAVVVAVAAALALAPYAVQEAAAGEPGSPTNLKAVDVSPTGIDLSWSAPDDDGGEDITGYKIERKEATETRYSTIKADTRSASTTYEDRKGIETGTAYVYRVSAINDDGESEPSAEDTARTTDSSKGYKQVVPEEPESLTADDISDSEVRLEWEEPDDNGSPPVTGYKIEYKEAGEDDDVYEVAKADTKSAETEYTVDDLKEDTEYAFRVSAINSVGTGDPSGEASATPSEDSTADTKAVKPGSPTQVKAAPASDTSLYVKWSAPAGSRGPDVTAYLIEYKQKSGEWEIAAEVGGDAGAFVHDVPNPKTSYSYRVTAINDEGASAPSGASDFIKPKDTDRPTQVSITALSPTSARLDWLPPSNTFSQSITQFEILKIFSNGVSDKQGSTGGKQATYTIKGLETDREHRFAVKAKLSTGETPESDTVAITLTDESGKGAAAGERTVVAQSPPGKPGSVKASAVSHERIDLTWSDPGSSGGQSITGYRIEFKEGDAGRFEAAESDSGSTARSYSHTGLDTETEYTYRISAISGQIVGPPSDDAPATTLDKEAGSAAAASAAASTGQSGSSGQSGSAAAQGSTKGPKPAPPRDLYGERVSEQQIDLSWSEPSTGADSILSYRVEYKVDDGPYETLTEAESGDTSYSHTDASPASSYTYKLYAVNENGQSRASNTAKVAATAGAGVATGAAAGDPRDRVPGFPDPETSADVYIQLYETDAEFREWFDGVFPEYDITDVVGEPGGQEGSEEFLFPDPSVSPSIYVDLYETDAGFRGWFDETYPGSTVADVVGASTGHETRADPRDRVPGFPDPTTSAREYVDRYDADAEFREWFGEVFPEYDIVDVVGEPEAAPPPEEPDRLQYYKDRYDGESSYRAWFDSYFFGRTLAEIVGTIDRPYGECGSGTVLMDGICQVDPDAGQ